MFLAVLATSYSGDGIYSGFINLMDQIGVNANLEKVGAVLLSTVTQLIPGFFHSNPSEKIHSFNGLGYLIHPDGIIDPNGDAAPILFGYCFVDFGREGFFSNNYFWRIVLRFFD